MVPRVAAFGFDESAIAEYRMREPMAELSRRGLAEVRSEDDFLAKDTVPGEKPDMEKIGDLLKMLTEKEMRLIEELTFTRSDTVTRPLAIRNLEIIQGELAKWHEKPPTRRVESSEAAENERRYIGFAEKSDVLFTQRYVTAERGALYTRLARTEGIPWVVDIDDHVMALDRENPGFKGYGKKAPMEIGDCREISDYAEQKDGELCFRHSKTGQMLAVTPNRDYLHGRTYRQVMGADALICGTRDLAIYYRNMRRSEHKPDYVYTIPYSVTHSRWSGLAQPEHDGEIRIGWLGADGHQREMQLLGELAHQALSKHKNVSFYWKCSFPEKTESYFKRHPEGCVYTPLLEAEKAYPGRCVRLREWVPHDDWPSFYANINLDIVLAPLADTAFKRCVSPVKWVEAAMLKRPTICDSMPGYLDAVKHRKSGIICKCAKDWSRAIDRLVESRQMRDELGGRAHEDAVAGFTVEANAQKYADAFAEVVAKLGPRARDRAKEMAA